MGLVAAGVPGRRVLFRIERQEMGVFVFPAIDLIGGRVVRLLRGDYDRQTTYQADPLDQACAFAAAGALVLLRRGPAR